MNPLFEIKSTHIGMARKFSWADMMTTKNRELAEMRYALSHAAYVRGLEIVHWDYQKTGPHPGASGGPLEMNIWVAVKGTTRPVDPTPGYDADGRECWEYPE